MGFDPVSYLIGKATGGSGGEGSSDFGFEERDYFQFPSGGGFGLTIQGFGINPDYRIEIQYEGLLYYNGQTIFGTVNTSQTPEALPFLVMGSTDQQMKTSNGASEESFSGSASGKHTFSVNDGGTCKFDGVTVVNSYTPANDPDAKFCLGWRTGGGTYMGKLYYFKIYSISTESLLADFVPANVLYKNNDRIAFGLIDRVTNDFVYINPSSGCSVGDDA